MIPTTIARSSPLGAVVSRATSAWAWVPLSFFTLWVSWYPFPYGNEWIYLPVARHWWNPTFLARDWALGHRWPENALFCILIGPFTQVLSLSLVAAIGRITTTAAQLWLLMRLARGAGLPPSLAALGIGCWIGIGQSLFGGEKILGTFEPKTMGYLALFAALATLVEGKILLAAALGGLSFSFHPSVGAQGMVALLLALPLHRPSTSRFAGFLVVAFAAALPGIASSLAYLFTSTPSDPGLYEHVLLERMPFHYDPFTFPKRALMTYALCLSALMLTYRCVTSEHRYGVAHLLYYSLGLTLVVTAGFLARYAGFTAALQLAPFRVGPALIPLFLILLAMGQLPWRLASTGFSRWRDLTAGTVTALALMILPDPVMAPIDGARDRREAWQREQDDIARTFGWLRDNTDAGVMLLLPPWRKDSHYRAERAQVLSAEAYNYSDMQGYRQRLADVTGRDAEDTLEGLTPALLEEAYLGLSHTQMTAIVRNYQVDYIVTSSDYPWPVVHQAGNYRVYSTRVAR